MPKPSDGPSPSSDLAAATPIVRVLLLDVGSGVGTRLEAAGDDARTRFVVTRAADVREAVQVAGRDRVDCAVLDVAALVLPDDVLALRRADPGMAFVVVGHPAAEDRIAEALVLGVEEHLAHAPPDAAQTARAVRFALARKRSEDARTRQALQDPVTGLPNRLALEELLTTSLQRAERRGTRIAVIFVRLGGLPAVAASQGQPGIDAVVGEVGRRLQAAARDSDTVGRLDDETMVVLCEDMELEVSVRRLAARVEEVLGEPFLHDGSAVELAPTFSFASASARQSAADLLRRRAGSIAELAFLR